MSDSATNSEPGADSSAADALSADAKIQGPKSVASSTLGGGDQSPYPVLAMDPDGPGLTGWIDRATQTVTSRLNPILVKEARQSLKSKQFLITFFCLLTASCGWTIIGIVFNAPDVYYIPSGDTFMIGYFLILSLSMFAFVPLVAFRSLAAELDEGTYEMLAITRLSAWRIVSGKMNSAVLQMMIYFSAIVPCLAFCYLLRGISLITIALSVAIIFITALVLTSLGLMLSTVAKGRTLQTFLLVGLVAFIVFVEFVCCGFVFSAVIPEQWSGTWFGFLSSFVVAGSFVILFLAAAAARVAPVTENRSTRLRGIMFIQQIIWAVTITYGAIESGDEEWFNYGMLWLGIYWLMIGMLMCGESTDLSPRVRRDLPATYATRMLFTWWTPGPGTGFMFVVSTGFAGLVVLGVAGMFVAEQGSASNFNTDPISFAALMIGYLFGYLGMIRLFSMPFLKRYGPSFVPSLIAAVAAYFLGMVLPAAIDVAIQGRIPNNYTMLYASNFMWTWDEALSSGGISVEVPVVTLLVGLAILAVNLFLLLREFRQTRVAIPIRVKQDQHSSG